MDNNRENFMKELNQRYNELVYLIADKNLKNEPYDDLLKEAQEVMKKRLVLDIEDSFKKIEHINEFNSKKESEKKVQL